MMVAGFPDHFTAPIATGILRKAGEALIDLPADYENIKGIWLFFRAYKKDGYSGDQYFGISSIARLVTENIKIVLDLE